MLMCHATAGLTLGCPLMAASMTVSSNTTATKEGSDAAFVVIVMFEIFVSDVEEQKISSTNLFRNKFSAAAVNLCQVNFERLCKEIIFLWMVAL